MRFLSETSKTTESPQARASARCAASLLLGVAFGAVLSASLARADAGDCSAPAAVSVVLRPEQEATGCSPAALRPSLVAAVAVIQEAAAFQATRTVRTEPIPIVPTAPLPPHAAAVVTMAVSAATALVAPSTALAQAATLGAELARTLPAPAMLAHAPTASVDSIIAAVAWARPLAPAFATTQVECRSSPAAREPSDERRAGRGAKGKFSWKF